ncbi:MAG: sigma-70 family RNA polymerase sigma factor [Thermomicrobia bacterium]|nr:sigma-70 family RNA polymerase sigma factor [Thermomicrobia bacterium]
MGADDTTDQNADATILRQIVDRDPRGVELLYDRYGGVAFALAYRLLGERGSAEDVVQEAFLNVWRQGATYDTRRGTVRTWLLTIVHHRAIDQMRSVRSKMGADTVIDDAMPLPAKEDTWTEVVQGLEHERVQQAMATLPPEQRQVVDLAYYGGFTHTEIAQRVGIPLGTVKGRMRLALDKLRDLLHVPDAVDEGMERAR